MAVSPDAWVQVGALVGVGLVGAAAGGMRRWAGDVGRKIDKQGDQLGERLDLVAGAQARVERELMANRERLASVETALRFVTGATMAGVSLPGGRRRSDVIGGTVPPDGDPLAGI